MRRDSVVSSWASFTPRGRTRSRWLAWAIWLAVTAISAAGLRHYRVDNQVTDWMPQLESSTIVRSYLVVGFDPKQADSREITAWLRAAPSVALCLDQQMLASRQAPVRATPEDLLVGDGGEYTGVICLPFADVGDDTFVREVRCALREAAGRELDGIAVGGPAVFHMELNAASQQRLPGAIAGIMIVGGVLLWWITGRWRAATAAVAAIALSQATLVGLIAWQGRAMDLALSLVPPMMMALGFSFAAHRALRAGVTGTLTVCALTTALGIGSFAAAGVVPIRDFALYGLLGLTLVWAAVLTLVPCPGTARASRIRSSAWWRSGLAACVAITQRWPWIVIAVCVLLSIAAIPAATSLRFETNPLAFFDRSARVARDFSTLDQRLTGMLPFEVNLRADSGADPRVLLETTPGVRKVIELAEDTATQRRHYWCLADNAALDQLAESQCAWQQWSDTHGADLRWQGVAAQLHGTGQVVKSVAIIALPCMAIVAALVVGWLTRRPSMALISAWVNLLPVAVGVLVAGFGQWPLSLPALMIGAIAVGVAVDDTLHLAALHAAGRSVRRILVECWRPCAGSSLVATVSMALFAISPFKPTAQFGLLVAVTVAVALAVDLLLLPSLLVVATRPARWKGRP